MTEQKSTTIIAEIGTAHGGSLEKAKKLIDEAVEAGADCIKFQWVYADEILHPDTGFVTLPGGNIRLYDRFKELEVSPDFFEKCLEYTHKAGAKFACSPFGLRSLKELVQIKPDAIKIASPEVNHYPMLEKISSIYGSVPVILSSGVSTLGDLEKAISYIKQKADCLNQPSEKFSMAPLTLLHCITCYPAPEEQYNVNCVRTLSGIFGLPTGISDHSLDPVLVPVLTVMNGGTMIEKHITLSKKTDGLDDPVALEGQQFALMVHCVRQTDTILNRYRKEYEARTNYSGKDFLMSQEYMEAKKQISGQLQEQFPLQRINAVLGDGVKKLAESETMNYGRTNRSLHYTGSFKKGHVITEKDIAVLRTEKVLTPGISPDFIKTVKGSILQADVSNGEGVLLEHFIVKA